MYVSLGVTDPWRGVGTVALSLLDTDEVFFQQPKHSRSEQSVDRPAYRRSPDPTTNQTGSQPLTIQAQISQNGHSTNVSYFTVTEQLMGTIVHGWWQGDKKKKSLRDGDIRQQLGA